MGSRLMRGSCEARTRDRRSKGSAGPQHIVAARGSVSVLETARRAEDPSRQYHHGSGSSARQKDSGGNAITTIPNLVAGILVVGHGNN